jgi:uncharacterized repeat protein (TIGR03803 family)
MRNIVNIAQPIFRITATPLRAAQRAAEKLLIRIRLCLQAYPKYPTIKAAFRRCASVSGQSRTFQTACQAAPALAIFFLLTSTTQAQTFSVLHQFRSGPNGTNPYAGLIRDAKGNLYGTTSLDGTFAAGTVFKLSATGKESVLYSFSGIGGDGAFPFLGSLFRDSAGNLYGTTHQGGTFDQFCPFSCGTVFQLGAAGKETVLYRFTGTGEDGLNPFAGVVRDPSGNLYGTLTYGGASGAGTVFKVDPAGQETILYSFTGGADGGQSYAGLIRDSAGNLYGTTASGGSGSGGVIFKLDPSGAETVLYNFTGPDGAGPLSGLIRDSAGNLYGTTQGGGASEFGTVFKLSPTGTETVLYSFAGGTDAQYPAYASLVGDKSGNLFGVTDSGGSYGLGAVFEVDNTGKETVLHSFAGTDGKFPYGTLVRDPKGNLYGTTYGGGAYGGGVVFKISP